MLDLSNGLAKGNSNEDKNNFREISEDVLFTLDDYMSGLVKGDV